MIYMYETLASLKKEEAQDTYTIIP